MIVQGYKRIRATFRRASKDDEGAIALQCSRLTVLAPHAPGGMPFQYRPRQIGRDTASALIHRIKPRRVYLRKTRAFFLSAVRTNCGGMTLLYHSSWPPQSRAHPVSYVLVPSSAPKTACV